ncbi:hypothetical protein QAO71_17110 (plasmid) [Halopseudomonas sp. SMJS2]|uniref:hypothetical protein n=1 Tax=Halopseudomonas sp. SMJS2 TaxID=3041098 RepID=UPI002452C05E|nr:hypothetical protein [Halopseudomonas sp. SMJS2]WGK63489.1 hypothetical protein QAO71_17110 [Halopseudomonas sp. SMJS2]
MQIISTRTFSRLAHITLRLRLIRLSEYCAAKAGYFQMGASMKAPRDMRLKSLAKWVMSNVTASVEQRFYVLGYDGILPASALRRIIAGTKAHRAWISGVMGVYKDEHGQHYGVCDREWTFYRVVCLGQNETSALTIVRHVLVPWSLPYLHHQRPYIAAQDQVQWDDDIPW